VDIRFICHVCGQHIAAPEEDVGQPVSCPNCTQPLTVPSNSTLPPATETRALPVFLQNLTPEARRLALEKPPYWEHLLLFQVWADEIDKRSSLICEDEPRGSIVPAEHVHKQVADQWLRKMADNIAGLIGAMDKLVTVSAPQSFGPPGQAGDVEKIVSVATMLGSVVDSMVQWVHRVRQARIDEPFTGVGVELAKMPIPLIDRAKRFPYQSIVELQNAIAAQDTTGGRTKLSLVLDVNVMDSSAFRAALNQAERKLMWLPGINDTRITTNKGLRTAQRRQEREARKRQRELEREAKEHAKLSAIEQARLEVETYENRVEMLLSVQKEQGEFWDWPALATVFAPPCPLKYPHHEMRERQRIAVSPQTAEKEAVIERARERDELEYQDALRRFTAEKSEWERMTDMARRILTGEHKAYIEALVQLGAFDEVSNLGSSIQFTVHSGTLLECVLTINGRQAIPLEVKSLTATGKVSVKAMPKRRFQEIYRGYVCGCVLRVAREVLALLPIDWVLVTASAETLDSRTGHTGEAPVLSAAMSRAVIAGLDFDRLNPSDAMENFLHRGDFKASRESDEFESITPLTPDDLPLKSTDTMELSDLVAKAVSLREALCLKIAELNPNLIATAQEEGATQ